MSSSWNPALYQSSHSFVWEYGKDLLSLLAPTAGERILDVGCGTGQLTSEIAEAGARTLGIDSSPSMIEQARHNYPGLEFAVQNVCDMEWPEPFDAVFSNAVLHWVRRADDAAAAIAKALRPGGRFVAEFGGHGNVRIVLEALRRALRDELGAEPENLNPWYFPTVGEYSSLLERHGLEVTFATLFDRPTPLEGGEQGLANWLAMFGGPLPAQLQEPDFVRRVERYAAPALLRDGSWSADYRRLRVVARKPA